MRDTNLIDVPDHTATKYFGAAVYSSHLTLLLMPATTYTLIYDEIIDDAHLRTSIGYGTTFKQLYKQLNTQYPEG